MRVSWHRRAPVRAGAQSGAGRPPPEGTDGMTAKIELDMDAQYNRQAFAVMQRCLRSDSNCVDVGSYIGTIMADILLVAPLGRHYAFEPIPESCARLREAYAAYPNVTVCEIALSDAAGTAPFCKVESDLAYSGLRKRWYGPGEHTVREIQVRTDLMDRVIPADIPIHFIKIDVEGAELQVMRGAAGIIRRHAPIIVFEHGLGAADKYGTTPGAVHELLAGCGLKVSLMRSWLAGEPPLTVGEFDREFHEGRNFYYMAHP